MTRRAHLGVVHRARHVVARAREAGVLVLDARRHAEAEPPVKPEVEEQRPEELDFFKQSHSRTIGTFGSHSPAVTSVSTVRFTSAARGGR